MGNLIKKNTQIELEIQRLKVVSHNFLECLMIKFVVEKLLIGSASAADIETCIQIKERADAVSLRVIYPQNQTHHFNKTVAA